ncbi:hypothetical protein BJX68DRAFT_74358 [Aspergillus pseudodeflectus]|uniref:Uncharacterized protein n=1 Tax=Aspergillus pseudodeflectus TaxID=176178 RepID=A0ABR4KF47_9EURO
MPSETRERKYGQLMGEGLKPGCDGWSVVRLTGDETSEGLVDPSSRCRVAEQSSLQATDGLQEAGRLAASGERGLGYSDTSLVLHLSWRSLQETRGEEGSGFVPSGRQNQRSESGFKSATGLCNCARNCCSFLRIAGVSRRHLQRGGGYLHEMRMRWMRCGSVLRLYYCTPCGLRSTGLVRAARD